MHCGVLVNVRLASTRLPRKHLLPAAGQSMLAWLLARCRRAFEDELAAGSVHLVIATSDEPCNDELDAFSRADTRIFRGSRRNLPLRHLQAADTLGLDAIVSVDGDDILCAPEAMRTVYEGLAAGNPGVRTRGLPLGMNAWGYGSVLLRESLANREDETFETGWGRLFDFSRFADRVLPVDGPVDDLRFTLDYEEDFRLFSAIFEALGESVNTMPTADVVAFARRTGLDALTRDRVAEYWENFRRERERDGAES